MTYVPGNFDSGHLYLQWGGKLPGGEVWSCGLRMASTDGSATSLDPGPMLAGVTAAVSAFHQAADTKLSSRALLSFVKLNYIDVSGHYAEDNTFVTVTPDYTGGGGTAGTPPNQVALAVSLLTGYSRGPAHRGRFYLPLPILGNPDTNGQVDATALGLVKTKADAFLTALNGVDAGYKVAVFSRKQGAPAHRLVTAMALGKVLDTQRRRRNKLVEAYI